MARRKPAASDLPPRLEAIADKPEYAWALIAWRKAAAIPGAYFDADLAEAIIDVWPTVFRLTQDRFAGLPFKLNTWQAICVWLFVGWKKPEEHLDPLTHDPVIYWVRVFRRLLLWIPRKNGKTEFLAALAWLFFYVDGVTDGEGYCFARDEKQAGILLRKIKYMVGACPEWANETQTFKRSLFVPSLRSSFEMLTGAEEGKHGASPTVVVGDEMHEWRTRTIADTLEEGTGARLQPVFLYGSTAGPQGNRAGDELWNESLAILEGRVDVDDTLVIVFRADPAVDDLHDEKVWARANPSIGLSPTWAYLRQQYRKAKDNPRAWARFCCYHLNVWIDAAVRWFKIASWDACAADKTAWKTYRETLKGRACFAALDVSSTVDVTALVFVFPPTDEDPHWRIAARFWVPEDTLRERVEADQVPYDEFKAAGALETTPGDYVDQNYVKRALLEGFDDFDVLGVAFDPWNARKLVSDLEAEGVAADLFTEFRQGIQSFAEPSKHFERLVIAGQLDHGGHPVLRWMAQNVVVRFDENLNFMPAKKRSREKIDGIVAGVMAVGLACAGEDVEPVNPWEDPAFSLGGASA